MATRTSIARSARLLSPSRALGAASRLQWQCKSTAWKTGQLRTFAVSSKTMEKKYTQDHEWIELDTDGKTVTLGISKYAASALGDVVYVELPQNDMEVVAGDAIGSVESVKSASDILTPVSGTVVETNASLEEKPASLNSDPEGSAWIAKIMIEGASLEEAASDSELMDAEAYKKYTEEASEE